MKLILASESPRRVKLLTTLGIPFAVEKSGAEELESGDPRRLPVLNAERKARVVAAKHPRYLVLGADTVIVAGDRVIGKPRDLDDALNILLALSGKTHEVITGIALVGISRKVAVYWSESTRVTFLPFDREVAEHYLSLVPVLDKAGAYAIQEYGELLVESIDGSLDNVIGLPLERLERELSRLLA